MALDKTLIYTGPVTSVTVGGTPVYETLDGVTVTCETEFLDIENDQAPGIHKKKKINQRYTVSFKVVHLTNALAKYAFAQPDANISGVTLTLNTSERAAEAIVILLPTVSGRSTILGFSACYALGVSSIVFGPRQQAAWELKFETIYSGGTYGYVAQTA